MDEWNNNYYSVGLNNIDSYKVEWIDGWMDEWMDGLMDGLMDGWIDGWID